MGKGHQTIQIIMNSRQRCEFKKTTWQPFLNLAGIRTCYHPWKTIKMIVIDRRRLARWMANNLSFRGPVFFHKADGIIAFLCATKAGLA